MGLSSLPCAPVVLLAFNRPDKLERVVEQIRAARPAKLFIGVDGPRAGFPGDQQSCSQVRSVLGAAIDWPCEVRRFDREANLGCEANVELTLDAVFTQVETAIVLEDDCVPDPSFFGFCTELLDRYAEDERIVHIAGTNDGAPIELFDGFSYAFTAFGSNCGWATWSRAWKLHRSMFPRPHDETTVRVPYGGPPYRYMPVAPRREFSPRSTALASSAARRFFGDVASVKDLSLCEWTQQWRLSMLQADTFSIVSAVNLIENVGFDATSTSGLPTRDVPRSEPTSFPLRHPDRVQINPRVERAVEVTLVRAVGRLARNVRRVTPSGLRDAARRIGRAIIR